MTVKLNRYSSRITEPRAQGASQAMLYGTGLTEEDHEQSLRSGIASVWYEGNTCNMHLNDLAAESQRRESTASGAGRNALQYDWRELMAFRWELRE